MVESIAGHLFAQTPNGRRCTICVYPFGPCNASWLHVRTMRFEDIGVTQGLAHVGMPNWAEYDQVEKERKREENELWTAIVDAASSGSR